jgi:hypothetical protein
LSTSHLNSLRKALAQRGWRIIAVHDRDDYPFRATWEIQRSTNHPSLLLDIGGWGPLGELLPLEESYVCELRGHSDISLYFRSKVNARRQHWIADLETFLDALDKFEVRKKE